MRIASYRHEKREGFGVVTDAGIVDLGRRLTDIADVMALLRAGVERARPHAASPADFALRDVALLPPVPQPGKIICVGQNYAAHAVDPAAPKPGYPLLFPRFADSLIGDGGAIVRPRVANDLDYEGEVAVIVGTMGRHIPVDRAIAHVAGYSIFNDASVRSWQRHTSQFMPGKNFVATGGFGPWLVTRDAVPDHRAMTLTTRLNGQVLQHARTDQMIYDIPYLIHYVSTFITLRPGDVIVSGTPEGLGWKREPPLFLAPGDTIEIAVDPVGVLHNPVVAEDTA